jgi:hypothetical protein
VQAARQVGCAGYNFRTHRQQLSTIGDTDDIFYDAGRRLVLVYVIGGEDAVEVLRQRDPDHHEPDGRITTAPGARTGLFVAVPHRGPQSARLLVYEAK